MGIFNLDENAELKHADTPKNAGKAVAFSGSQGIPSSLFLHVVGVGGELFHQILKVFYEE
jgi:hypothetical protein